jgi:GT2 family glycosyltransferase
MNEPLVYIVVPVHNRIEYTLKFLASARLIDYSNYKIVVIDDGSTDDTADILSKEYPEVIMLKGSGDDWWTKSVNAGIKYSLTKNTDFILTLNNDLIVDKDIIKEYIALYQKFPKSLVGGIVYDISNSDRVFCAGGHINRIKTPHFDIIPYGIRDSAYQEVREVDFLTGMGCFIPAIVFQDVGYYDEQHLPQYFADAELTLRAKNAGYRLLFTPAVKMWNYTESTTWQFPQGLAIKSIKKLLGHKGSQYYFFATIHMYFKHWPLILAPVALFVLYAKCLGRLVLSSFPYGRRIIARIIERKYS